MSRGYKSLNIFFSKNNFINSFINYEQIDFENLPEICFVGRSNVGKSSLINKITKTKKLAKTSKVPGKTKSINFYDINNKVIFADLPGYGYAKISKKLRDQLMVLIKDYLLKRKNLNKIFLLIDCKIGLKNNDLEILSLILESKINFTIILTKIDKCTRNILDIRKKEMISILSNYSNYFSEIIFTSVTKNIGINDIKKIIYKITT